MTEVFIDWFKCFLKASQSIREFKKISLINNYKTSAVDSEWFIPDPEYLKHIWNYFKDTL